MNNTPAIRLLVVTCALASASAVPAVADTVACYRFENGVTDQPFGPADNRDILDSSGHNFTLTTYNKPVASADVPANAVPLTGEKNTCSIHFNETENIIAPPNCPLSSVTFTNFTIEAWVNFDRLDGWQTIIGRDDSGSPGEGTGLQSLFYLSKTTDVKPGPDQTANALRIELVTRDNRLLAINSNLRVFTQTWYHVAVVGDAEAGTLSLYVEGTKIASTNGFTGLFAPKQYAPWTLGRGQYRGKATDYFHGCLDEVRFSDTALPPTQFLNATGTVPPH